MLSAVLALASQVQGVPPTRPSAQSTEPSAAAAAVPETIVPHAWLVIAPVDNAGRRPFRPDVVFANHLLDRSAPPPVKDEAAIGEIGKEQRWQEKTAKDDGTVGGKIGWAYTQIESSIERVMIAKLSGASKLFVNGTGFVGDEYGYGFGGVPVLLVKGANDVYVAGARGAIKLELRTPRQALEFGNWDVTRPDLVAGEPAGDIGPLGLLWLNATTSPMQMIPGCGQANSGPDQIDPGIAFVTGRSTRLLPLALAKTPVELSLREPIDAAAKTIGCPISAWLTRDQVERFQIELEVRGASDARCKTFLSRIDGSAQFYALLPAANKRAATFSDSPPGIVLTLHGAGVDALGHVRAYSQKDDFWLFAPTNRRPFGFDWQDWGREDVYEVLWQAQSYLWEEHQLAPNEEPIVYLTGHSMGGHGTWHLAANGPETFAAIAPSAAWSSFDSYGGRPDGALKPLWHAADLASDTLALISNLKQIPTFILHGTADDNVPIGEAKKMQSALEDAGAKPIVHYQEGAGHWWDGEASPGVDCVDWPGIFDLFRKSGRREPSAELDLTTVDGEWSGKWIYLQQPLDYGQAMHVHGHLVPEGRKLVITTENIRRFEVIAPVPGWPGRVVKIDEREFTLDEAVDVRVREFVRSNGEWRIDETRDQEFPEKWSRHSGPFKRAFDNAFVLVYGTRGTAAENRELLERARYDAETWWYRANATPLVLSDRQFLEPDSELGPHIDHNLILYGNADTNSAWPSVFGATCPLQARRGLLKLDAHEWKGDDLGAVLVFPETETVNGRSSYRLCGAFADTGVRGTRLGYTLAPFISGVGYPDYALYSSDVLSKGDGGVLAAGWFDATWKLDGRGYVRPEKAENAEKNEKR